MALVETQLDNRGVFRDGGSTDLDFTVPVMTTKEIAKAAIEQGGYRTASLNDKLYLHYKGYQRIENLEEYANLKAIWLDSNGFQKIENINHLAELRCLFLQRNLISTIENLDGLRSLVQLDLSENRIAKVEGLSVLPNLSTLNLARNALADGQSISHLNECTSLSVLDLSHNNIQGNDVVDTLAKIPKLVALNVAGNPVVSKFSYFRKRSIVAIKGLKYLDSPVFDMERATAEAWSSGGREAELAMRNEWQKKKAEENRKGVDDFRKWQAEIRAKKLKEQEEAKKNGPSPGQVAESERREGAKLERQAAAGREAERERRMHCLPQDISEDAPHHSDRTGAKLVIEEVSEISAANASEPRAELVPTETADNHEESTEPPPLIRSKTESISLQEPPSYLPDDKQLLSDHPSEDSDQTACIDRLSGDAGGWEPALEPSNAGRSQENEPAVGRAQTSSILPIEKKGITKEIGDEQRSLLVEESLAIYRARKESLLAPSLSGDGCNVFTDQQTREDAPHTANGSVQQWSEDMDRCLTRHVQAAAYDFEVAARNMRSDFPTTNEKLLDAESCRIRWCLLDSSSGDEETESEQIHWAAKDNDHFCAKIIKNKEGNQATLAEMPAIALKEGMSSFQPPMPPDADQWSDDEVSQARFLGRNELWKLQETNFETLD